jgi:hypothetical protein
VAALLFAPELLEIIEHSGNEFLFAGILRGQGAGEKIGYISGLLGGFALFALHLGQQPSQIGGLLRSRPATLIKIDRLLRHRRISLA